ncbi:MAG: hypothetical protein J3K34DRAFT_521571 [Monoraphidium minutum]|nr:MAG: hypothetical protein J3K34DRAFT_521571 [Monoraphidium minutum]
MSEIAKTPLEIEHEQEAMLAKRYGGMLKRKQSRVPKDHKYFDSADWALAKEGKGEGGGPTVSMEEALPPRTSPVGPSTVAAHRASKLEGPAPEHAAAAP